jgi:hypothetical protein
MAARAFIIPLMSTSRVPAHAHAHAHAASTASTEASASERARAVDINGMIKKE